MKRNYIAAWNSNHVNGKISVGYQGYLYDRIDRRSQNQLSLSLLRIQGVTEMNWARLQPRKSVNYFRGSARMGTTALHKEKCIARRKSRGTPIKDYTV